jgi:hypothetical protein
MSTSVDDALKKITALNDGVGVRAAFVFNQYQAILAREVPENYGNDVLKRIAGQIHQMAVLSWNSGAVTQEFRLVYDKMVVYTRLFAQQLYLVVFLDKSADTPELRQPMNLSVLMLEKAFRRGQEKFENTPMALVAALAEQSLRTAADRDETFAGNIRRFCFQYLGLHGNDLVDFGIEDELLIIPLRSEEDMRKLVNYITARVAHPLLRRIIEEDLEGILKTTLKS